MASPTTLSANIGSDCRIENRNPLCPSRRPSCQERLPDIHLPNANLDFTFITAFVELLFTLWLWIGGRKVVEPTVIP